MKKTILVNPLLLFALSLLPLEGFALQKMMYTIPIKFSVVNPCNGDTVKVSGKLREIISMIDKVNFLVQHNVTGINAIGASGVKYKVTVDKEFSNVKLATNQNSISQPGPTYKMMSEKLDMVPNFSIEQTMTTTLNPNGTVSLLFANMKTHCK